MNHHRSSNVRSEQHKGYEPTKDERICGFVCACVPIQLYNVRTGPSFIPWKSGHFGQLFEG